MMPPVAGVVVTDLLLMVRLADLAARRDGLPFRPAGETLEFLQRLADLSGVEVRDTPLARQLAQEAEPQGWAREYDVAATAALWEITTSGVRWLLAQDGRLRRHARKTGRAWVLDADFVDVEAERRRAHARDG